MLTESPGSRTLRTNDPVSRVAAFYTRELERGGWTFVSRSVTPASASFTVKRSGQGATIAVSKAQQGSGISISTYPAG